MPTSTPNLNLTLPDPNVSVGWGGTLNSDFTLIDNLFSANGSGTSIGINVGSGKTASIGGTLIAGGTVILGSGDNTNTVTSPVIRGAARTGTDVVGANLTIDACNGTGTGGSGKITFRTASAGSSSSTANTFADRLVIDSSGNVGIGTSSPSTKLDVNGDGRFGNRIQQQNSGGSDFEIGPGAGTGDSTIWGFYAPTSRSISFSTNASERFRIGSSGQLGVGGANYGTSGQALVSGGSGTAPSWGNIVSIDSVQNIAASGNSFTGIPSTARQIIISVRDLTAGVGDVLIRLGTASGFATTGYISSAQWNQGGSGLTRYSSSGLIVNSAGTSYPLYGAITLTNMGGNVWSSTHAMGSSYSSSPISFYGGGTSSLSGVLDRVQVVPASGTFTVIGTVNIIYF